MINSANPNTPAPTTRQAPIALVGVGEIVDLLLTISEQRVTELTNRKDFPKPTDVLAAGDIWFREDVETWISQHGDIVANMFSTNLT